MFTLYICILILFMYRLYVFLRLLHADQNSVLTLFIFNISYLKEEELLPTSMTVFIKVSCQGLMYVLFPIYFSLYKEKSMKICHS
jgi:hypothetical protein